jgi:hypothetical protein
VRTRCVQGKVVCTNDVAYVRTSKMRSKCVLSLKRNDDGAKIRSVEQSSRRNETVEGKAIYLSVSPRKPSRVAHEKWHMITSIS